MPAVAAARITDVPGATSTAMPSMVTATVASPGRAGVPRSGCLSRLTGSPPAKCSERRAHRHRGETAHRAQRSVGHQLAEVVEQREVRVAVLAGADPVDHLDAADRADAAGRALAARLLGAELHGEAGHAGHVDGVVEDHDAAVADHRADRGERLVVDGDVEAAHRQVGAERTADLHGPHRTTRGRAAAEPLDQLAQGDAERGLDDAAPRDVAGQLEDARAPGAPDAVLGVGLRAVGQDPRHRGQGEHVVDDGGPAEQALEGGDRRLGPHHAALALEALEHRRLLAADVGAGADAHVQVEGEIGPEDVLTEPAPARAASIAASMATMASGYSERM